MRSAILLFLGILLLSAGAAAGWLVARRGMPDAEPKPAPQEQGHPAVLESVDHAEQALRLAGFERAFVYRWEECQVDGTLHLDGPQGTGIVSLNTEPLCREAYRDYKASYDSRLGVSKKEIPTGTARKGPKSYEQMRVRGLIVIAIREAEGDATVRKCIAAISAEVKADGVNDEGNIVVGATCYNTYSGWVPKCNSSHGGNYDYTMVFSRGTESLPELGASTVALLGSMSGPGPLFAAAALVPGRTERIERKLYELRERQR
jgi:hypothetical protein